MLSCRSGLSASRSSPSTSASFASRASARPHGLIAARSQESFTSAPVIESRATIVTALSPDSPFRTTGAPVYFRIRHARLAGVVVRLVQGKARDLRVAHEQRDRGPVRAQRLDREHGRRRRRMPCPRRSRGRAVSPATSVAHAGAGRRGARTGSGAGRSSPARTAVSRHRPARAPVATTTAPTARSWCRRVPAAVRERAREPVESRQRRGRQHVDAGRRRLPRQLRRRGRPVDHRDRVTRARPATRAASSPAGPAPITSTSWQGFQLRVSNTGIASSAATVRRMAGAAAARVVPSFNRRNAA